MISLLSAHYSKIYGTTERANQKMREMLRFFLVSGWSNWCLYLFYSEVGHNTSEQNITLLPSFRLNYTQHWRIIPCWKLKFTNPSSTKYLYCVHKRTKLAQHNRKKEKCCYVSNCKLRNFHQRHSISMQAFCSLESIFTKNWIRLPKTLSRILLTDRNYKKMQTVTFRLKPSKPFINGKILNNKINYIEKMKVPIKTTWVHDSREHMDPLKKL